MTQEDKELLLNALCARLPYKPFAQWHHETLNKFCDVKIMEISTYGKNIDDYHINVLCQPEPGVAYEASIVDIKPYLRPLSSMTEEEKETYHNLCYEEEREEFEFGEWVTRIYYHDTIASIDWLNAHYFDYCGLIEEGLAIEVTKENNPYEQNKS